MDNYGIWGIDVLQKFLLFLIISSGNRPGIDGAGRSGGISHGDCRVEEASAKTISEGARRGGRGRYDIQPVQLKGSCIGVEAVYYQEEDQVAGTGIGETQRFLCIITACVGEIIFTNTRGRGNAAVKPHQYTVEAGRREYD